MTLGYVCDVQAVRRDLWTGYEEVLAAAGGLFGTGSAEAYLRLRPWTEKEMEARAETSGEPAPADPNGSEGE